MRQRHICLTGAPGLGDQYDCAVCRASLLEAFREPVRTPEPAPVQTDREVSAESSASPWFRPPLVHLPGEGCLPGGMHDMTSAIEPPLPGSNLGTWWVECNCGFKREGSYMQPHIAASIVSSWNEYHIKHPEDRT